MINGIRGNEFNEKDFIKINFNIAFSVFLKLLRTKYISKHYELDELIKDEK